MKRWQAPLVLAALVLAAACADTGALVSVDGVRPALTLTTVSVVCPDTIQVGQSAQCIHYAYDENNNFISGTTATWSTSTPSLISVSSSGLITGLAVGNASVQGTSGGVNGSRGVYVRPGLSISIDGPGPVRRYQTCSWFADATGGAYPYTYTWQVSSASGTAYGYEWNGYTISSIGFTLKVNVTDANGVKGSLSRYVSVSPSAPAYC